MSYMCVNNRHTGVNMRFFSAILFVLALPAAAGCGADLATEGEGTRGVPTGAIAAESLESTWTFELRSISDTRPMVSDVAHALVADGELEFAIPDGIASVIFNVQNFDPRVSACHPNGIILDDACPDPSTYPYVILESAPVEEIFIGDTSCLAFIEGSAVELTVDDAHTLHRLRAIAPVHCPGEAVMTFEIRLERLDAIAIAPTKPQIGEEPILIGDGA